MGTQEAPGPDSPIGIRVWRLLWLPASPEAAFGLPMTELRGGLRAPSMVSVSPW